MPRKRNQGSKWIRKTTRFAIYSRDGWTCCYCGESDELSLTLDHIRPCEHGGSNRPENLITACLGCNSRKKALTFDEWLDLLGDDGTIELLIQDKVCRPLRRAS